VWVFVSGDDSMRKEQRETVTSAKRFGLDVVETVWKGANHGGIFRNAMSDQTMLDWLVKDRDMRQNGERGEWGWD
jgi:hypothetical protein